MDVHDGRHDPGAGNVSGAALYLQSDDGMLYRLDASTGAPAWTRYIWFSWIESPAAIRGDTA